MKKLHTLGMGAVVATAAFSLFALTANAQQPAPTTTAPANPAVVAPVKPAVPPAAPAAAKAPATAPAATTPTATTKAKAPAKVSACKSLDETGCKANPECGYVVPTKADAKTGKVDKPYCRKVAGVAVKKPAAAAGAATTAPAAAKATTTAPVAPKVTAPTTPVVPKPNATAPATKQ